MKAIERLHDEHLSMAAIFQALDRLLDGIASQKIAPDFQLLASMLDYIIREPEQLHHPKEDSCLFPVLLKRNERCRDLVDKLEREHHESRNQIKGLSTAFIQYQSQGEAGFAHFESAARTYIHFGIKHIELEERELLPALRDTLTQADWNAIDAEFCAHVTGENGEFSALFTKVVSMLPAPLGVGGATNQHP